MPVGKPLCMILMRVYFSKDVMKVAIQFTFPYDQRLSKNLWHVYTGATKNQWEGLPGVPVAGKRRAVVNTQSANILMEGIERVSRGECILLERKGFKFLPHKIWIHIMVYKPDMRLDAINVLGMICDGIKRGIKVDDNVFSAVVDWELVAKGSERIEIRVEQEQED